MPKLSSTIETDDGEQKTSTNPLKVGIITFHHTTNYGARLQAYALATRLKMLGHQVEIIDYRPVKAIVTYAKALWWNKSFLQNTVKYLKFKLFLYKYMPTCKKTYYSAKSLKEKCFPYDILMCGSDEIWNIKSTVGFDKSFFLDFADVNFSKKCSYAVSVGHLESFEAHQKVISLMLNEFSHVSVRDSNTLRILRDECNVHAVKVLDPTFLIDFASLLQSNPIKGAYILIYGPLTFEEQCYVKSIANERRLQIISVGYKNSCSDKNFISAGVEQWLTLFEGSSLVCTVFYHGVIFAIKYRKKFFVFMRPKKNTKILDLLADIGLENRMFDMQNSVVGPKTESWDVSLPTKSIDIIDNRIDESIVFLRRCFE